MKVGWLKTMELSAFLNFAVTRLNQILTAKSTSKTLKNLFIHPINHYLSQPLSTPKPLIITKNPYKSSTHFPNPQQNPTTSLLIYPTSLHIDYP
jgi:hypothetical protein